MIDRLVDERRKAKMRDESQKLIKPMLREGQLEFKIKLQEGQNRAFLVRLRGGERQQ